MSEKRNILVQLDTDGHPSLFDRIVALDACADDVLSYGGVRVPDVGGFVRDAIFTRGPKDLVHTAIAIGGSDADLGDALLAEARTHLLPQWGLQVSLMADCNGSHTTPAAAVRLAARHLDLSACRAAVLGGGGRIGRRLVALLLRAGANVLAADVDPSRLRSLAEGLGPTPRGVRLATMLVEPGNLDDAVVGRDLIIAAGPPGVRLLGLGHWQRPDRPHLLIDLNAVPPAGIEGIAARDKAADRNGTLCYGAIGIGELKMKIHKRAVAELFQGNDRFLDLAGIHDLAVQIG